MGVAVSVAVYTAAGGYGSPGAFAAGFGPAMGVAAGLAGLGFLVALALPRR